MSLSRKKLVEVSMPLEASQPGVDARAVDPGWPSVDPAPVMGETAARGMLGSPVRPTRGRTARLAEEFSTDDQKRERERLHKIIEQMVLWKAAHTK